MTLVVVETLPVGPLQCNCSILADEGTRQALVVDPGDEVDTVLNLLEANGLTAVGLLHTHAHFDHIAGAAKLKELTGAPILLHEGDLPLYENLSMQARTFGFRLPPPGKVDRLLTDGAEVACGAGRLSVLHTPGHTPGSLCFHLEAARPVLFSGDTLFRRSIGRTDLWGGSMDEIVASIQGRLYALPGDVLVLPGHGETTTIHEERRLNPFVPA